STLVTLLFGLGWHALHRVAPNAATDRWCRSEALGPAWGRRLNGATERILAKMPPGRVRALAAGQRGDRPFYAPAALVREMDARMADVTPLYAGECVASITELARAADVVNDLAGAF